MLHISSVFYVVSLPMFTQYQVVYICIIEIEHAALFTICLFDYKEGNQFCFALQWPSRKPNAPNYNWNRRIETLIGKYGRLWP